MPIYEFSCAICRLQFKRNLKIAEHLQHDCPRCHSDADRVWSGIGGHKFGSSSSSVANTGVHTDDYPTADRAVGKSAEERWNTIVEREKVKKAARATNDSRALIRRDGNGFIEYEGMPHQKLEARRELAEDLIGKLKAQKEQAKSDG